MKDEKNIDRRMRSMSYVHEQYNNRSDKNRIENKEEFREGFSIYSIPKDQITYYVDKRWNGNNRGGIPMDYDSQKKEVYVDSSDAHTLLIGATGSKKSRMLVFPTVRILASAGESMVISDPKGEIYRRTAAILKKKGYCVSVINLRNPKVGDGWNFLEMPYQKYLMGDVDKACEMISDAAVTLMAVSLQDPYWDQSARDLFVGLVLLLFKICKDSNFPIQVVNMKSLLELRTEMFLVADTSFIKKTKYWRIAERDKLIKMKLSGTVGCPEKTLSCILSTFDQHVSCFSLQPQLIEMLSHTTIDFERFGYEKSVLYFIIPDEKTTYHKLVTIFIKQLYEYLINYIYDEKKENYFPRRINFVLDEFSALPCINDFPQMISASRSRNIRFFLVMQSKSQLRQRYNEETDTIQSNCSNWMFLHTREIELLREISALGGNKGRDELISVAKLQHLDKEKGECLIFSGRKYPYYAYLPDIAEYDNDVYDVLAMSVRDSNTGMSIDWDRCLETLEELNLDELFESVNDINGGQ